MHWRPGDFPLRAFRLIAAWLLAIGVARAQGEPPKPAHPLVWDAVEKSIDAKPGEDAATFRFTATNHGTQPIEILSVTPSCGCTVADVPKRPWILAPREQGSFTAVVDFRGKHGRFAKSLYVASVPGTQMLTVVVNIPDTPEAERERNRQLATLDRQAVFRGECASCHAARATGKKGEELFAVACGICHLAAHRASMVPDLLVAREKRDADYWRKWIGEGKDGTLMPAFAQKHQGPLTDEQITSLIEFALARLPTEPRTP